MEDGYLEHSAEIRNREKYVFELNVNMGWVWLNYLLIKIIYVRENNSDIEARMW